MNRRLGSCARWCWLRSLRLTCGWWSSGLVCCSCLRRPNARTLYCRMLLKWQANLRHCQYPSFSQSEHFSLWASFTEHQQLRWISRGLRFVAAAWFVSAGHAHAHAIFIARKTKEKKNPLVGNVRTPAGTSNINFATRKKVLYDWESRNLCVLLGAWAPKNVHFSDLAQGLNLDLFPSDLLFLYSWCKSCLSCFPFVFFMYFAGMFFLN